MTGTKRPKYVLISVLMLLLFNYPLLGAANKLRYVGDLPVLYLYLAVVWLLTIVLLLLTALSGSRTKRPGDE
jgi:hypothetical protein